MGRLEFIIILLVACCLVKIGAAVEVFKTKHLPSKVQSIGIPITLQYGAFDKDRLIYFATSGETLRKRNVTVYLSEKPFENALYSCNVTLKGDHNSTVIERVRLQHLGKDRALIWWWEKTPLCEFEPERCPESIVPKRGKYKEYVNFVAIHFPTCKATETKIEHSYDRDGVQAFDSVLPNDTYYNLFLLNPKLCKDRRCRMKIDYDGKIISGPTPSISVDKNYWLEELQPLDGYSLENGYVCMKTNWLLTVVQLIDSRGSEKLKILRVRKPLISIANRTIGICEYPDIRDWDIRYVPHCTQYDLAGNLKWEWSSIRENVHKEESLITILNLDDGGLLLLLKHYERSCEYCHWKVLGYSVKKIDATGKYVGEFYLKGLEDTDNLVMEGSIWKSKDTGDYCAAYARPTEEVTKDFTIVLGNCFTDADFS